MMETTLISSIPIDRTYSCPSCVSEITNEYIAANPENPIIQTCREVYYHQVCFQNYMNNCTNQKRVPHCEGCGTDLRKRKLHAIKQNFPRFSKLFSCCCLPKKNTHEVQEGIEMHNMLKIPSKASHLNINRTIS